LKLLSFPIHAVCALFVVSEVIGCDSPTEPSSRSVLLDRHVVADVFGNHDGVASSDELLALDDFFRTNGEAWCVSSLAEGLWNSNEASADQVKACFIAMATRPYPSEQALRQAYAGINIRTPYVSIAVLHNNSFLNENIQFQLTKFFRSPGSGISSAHWDILTVK
jgi:hypothetical protein